MAGSAVIYTTQADFETGIWTPTGSVDLTTEPGIAAIAAGYTKTEGKFRGQHPNWSADGWGDWRFIGWKPGASRVYGRIRVATTEGGLDAASWTPYMGGWLYVLDVDGLPLASGLGIANFDIGVALLNLGLMDVGPWFEQHIIMMTD